MRQTHRRGSWSAVAVALALASAMAACSGNADITFGEGSANATRPEDPNARAGDEPGSEDADPGLVPPGATPPDPDAGAPTEPPTPTPPMTFFVSSDAAFARGGNLGGLEGADQRCQTLATAAGSRGRTWRAYLSASAVRGRAVNARDRIGDGPWHNAKGETVAASRDALHAQGVPDALLLDERGARPTGAHVDVLTGSDAQGRPALASDCRGWTYEGSLAITTVGHADTTNDARGTWNNAHTAGCSARDLATARLYCFAL